MNVNDKVDLNGEQFTVTSLIGEGGQGSVWRVKSLKDGKEYALKLICESDKNRNNAKVSNIRKIVKERLEAKTDAPCKQRGLDLVFPIVYGTVDGETVYLMEIASGKTLNKMLLNGEFETMTVEKKLKIAKKVASAIDVLHTVGYCYTDINWGNFMYDENRDVMSVIDCENVACTADIESGKCAFLKGTGFFIAPEVAFNNAKASKNSDLYALPSIIFRILTNNALQSAYHGAVMYSQRPMPLNMMEVADNVDEGDLDDGWKVFIFDENNRINGIDSVARNNKNPENIKFRKQLDEAEKVWKSLDDRIKDMFYRAFSNPFAINSRPSASLWVRIIDEVLNPAAPKNQGQAVRKAQSGSVKPPVQNVQKPSQNGNKQYVPFQGGAQGAGATGSSGAAKPWEKYRVFEHGKEEPPAPKITVTAADKPCILGADGNVYGIAGDDVTLYGADVGMPGRKEIGTLKKTAGGYEFLSLLSTNVQILGADGKTVVKTVSKGQKAVVESGWTVKPVVAANGFKVCY